MEKSVVLAGLTLILLVCALTPTQEVKATVLIVDDFESYSVSNPIVPTWAPTGDCWIYTEDSIVHGGLQSMKFTYNGGGVELCKWMVDLSDWTAVDTLSIWFRGSSSNSTQKMYVCVLDDWYNYAYVYNDDPGATKRAWWTNWQMNLAAFTGVDLANVLTFLIGFEYVEDGPGQIYFDDIELLGPPPSTETPAGSNVTVSLEDDTNPGTTPVTLVFKKIDAAGETSLATSDSGQTPPVGFQLGDPATYYEITTTAAYDGLIVVCIDYSGVSYSDPELLRLHHYEGDVWVDCTVSNDTINQIICGEVTSLSPFAVFQGDPIQLVQQLVQQILDLNLKSGIENSLDAKLDAVLKAIDDLNENNNVAAINVLGAFINAVEAQRGKQIPVGDADALIAAAQYIVDLLT